MNHPICCGEVIENVAMDKSFFYCRGCKQEVPAYDSINFEDPLLTLEDDGGLSDSYYCDKYFHTATTRLIEDIRRQIYPPSAPPKQVTATQPRMSISEILNYPKLQLPDAKSEWEAWVEYMKASND